MGRTIAVVICPQCERMCRVYSNNVMTQHKSHKTRHWCKFSGGTWEDAKLGISPRMRRIESHYRRLAKYENRQLIEKECKQLAQWGIL